MKLSPLKLCLFLLCLPMYVNARQVDFSIASDVLIYVGDGIGDPQHLEQRLSVFTPPKDTSPEVFNSYINGRNGLQQLLDDAARGEEMSWSSPKEISGDLRRIVEHQAQINRDASLLLEYLTLRYLSRHYLGFVDSVPSNDGSITSRSDAELVKELDDKLRPALSTQEQSTWRFVKRTSLDVDSSTGEWLSTSGRPLTPLPFYSATRKLIGRM